MIDLIDTGLKYAYGELVGSSTTPCRGAGNFDSYRLLCVHLFMDVHACMII